MTLLQVSTQPKGHIAFPTREEDWARSLQP